MPKKSSAPRDGASVRKKLAELNAQLQQAQAVADADRRIADAAKAEAKRARKAHKQARKAAKGSKKQVKALRRQIKDVVAGDAGVSEAKPKTSPKRSRKSANPRAAQALTVDPATPESSNQSAVTPVDEATPSPEHPQGIS